MPPLELMRQVGIDLSSAQPIHRGDRIRDALQEGGPERNPDPGPSHPTQEEQHDHA